MSEGARADRRPGDEEIPGMSLTYAVGSPAESQSAAQNSAAEPEMLDPAIIAVGLENRATRQYQYTRDKLLELRNLPLSKRRPDFVNPANIKSKLTCFVNRTNGISSQGFWDQDRWHPEWKRSETPSDGGSRNEPPENHKSRNRSQKNSEQTVELQRRSGDPRERIRKEQDGIVLSPQRRSFNSGCFVPVTRTGRPESPLGKDLESNRPIPWLGSEHRDTGHREMTQCARRIGSGRIIARDVSWDYRPDMNDRSFRTDTGLRKDSDRDQDERHERRSFGRDFDRDRDRHINRNGRYGDRRRISAESKEDEPEWFSGGPTSQADTIELRGFDDCSSGEPEKSTSKKKASPSRKKRNRSITFEKDSGPKGRSTPMQEGPAPAHSPIKEETQEEKNEAKAALDFNLEEFLKMDSIPELLTNGVGTEAQSTGSRFSRWFNKEASPVQSRRSSLQEDHLVNNIINDLAEPNIVIPGLGDSDNYFAPISPAANTGPNVGPAPGSKPVTLLEMLQRGKQPAKQPSVADVPPVMKNMDVPGKVLSLEELEARIRQTESANMSISMGRPKHDEDMSAFNRLVSGGQAIPASNGPLPHKQPMSLLQMLNKSQQDDARAAHMMGPLSPGNGPHIPNDLVLKLHQVQQVQQRQQQQQAEMLSKLMGSAPPSNAHRQFAMPPEMPMPGSNRELLQRPEAIAILQGLKRGDITPQHLLQQLAANPAMQPRHRELLSAILRQGPVPSPRGVSPAPPQQMLYQQQQQLRVSPLPNAYCVSPILATSPNTLTVHHPAMPQRIPSPRELQAHTQSIMQRALIKKKLEEQQENYRKKQEMQREQSPSVAAGGSSATSPAKHMSSPTPLAFTPTSVLRKMTAEKDLDNPKDKEMPKSMGQGRPVTGMRLPQPQNLQQAPPNWNMLKQPVGRPIVKGNANFQFVQQEYGAQQRMNAMYQQQRKVPSQPPGQAAAAFGLQNRIVVPPPMSRGAPVHMQHPHRGNSWQQFLMDQNFVSGRGMLGRGSPGDGDLSPTSDQLARWFSPELLARARAGKLPDMPAANLAQNALSLEELERIQQNTAPVHN